MYFFVFPWGKFNFILSQNKPFNSSPPLLLLLFQGKMQAFLLFGCFVLAVTEYVLSSAHMVPDEGLSSNRVFVSGALSQNLEMGTPPVVIVGKFASFTLFVESHLSYFHRHIYIYIYIFPQFKCFLKPNNGLCLISGCHMLLHWALTSPLYMQIHIYLIRTNWRYKYLWPNE